MTSPSDARTVFDKRHAQMRQNAGDWLLKNRNVFQLVQSVLVSKYYETIEGLSETDHDPSLCCFLHEIDDAIDLLASTVADLRNQQFWPDIENTEITTKTNGNS